MKKGFTLIELILVVSLLAVVGLATFQALSNGIRIWERSQRFAVEEDVMIFMDKIQRDLRNTVNYSLLPFEGKANKISIPTLVRSNVGKKGEQIFTTHLGRVEYSWDMPARVLIRRQANYGQAIEKEWSLPQDLAARVHSLKFSYYYVKEKKVELKNFIPDESGIPSAVLIEVEFEEGDGHIRNVTRLVNLPLGNIQHEKIASTPF